MTHRPRRLTPWLALLLLTAAPPARARVAISPPPSLLLDVPTSGEAGAYLVADEDDDDDNGVVDSLQAAAVPTRDLIAVTAQAARAELFAEGGVRLIVDGAPVDTLEVRGRRRFYVQGLRPSASPGDARVTLRDGAGNTSAQTFTVLGLDFERADGGHLDPATEALGVSRQVTNDLDVPRGPVPGSHARDPEAIRARLRGPAMGDDLRVRWVRVGGGQDSQQLALALSDSSPRVSAFVRLVGDAIDDAAPTMEEQTLRVALRDRVELRVETPSGTLRQAAPVGRPGAGDGPRAARRARLRLRVLRARTGGRPSVGTDDAGAIALMRLQVAVANEIWLQCFVDFGAAEDADVAVVDPPPPYLLAIADVDGLPATGGGLIRLRADGRPIEPVTTREGDAPVETARRVARALTAAGFAPTIVENRRVGPGAGPSADLLVRHGDGSLATLDRDGDSPLSTDARQRLRIARVDLSDGLEEYDNATALAGTLEERALLHAVTDDDPTTLDVVVVPSFTRQTRQGESFIEADGGSLVNVVVLDRNAVAASRAAWTQSHELGHLLLDEPFHPDDFGPDRPWLLMDANSQRPTVRGPKRLTWNQCLRARARSGIHADPVLLARRPES